MPTLTTLIIAFIAALFIPLGTLKLPKKHALFIEMSLIVTYIAVLFIVFQFHEAMILFTIAATTYAEFETLLQRNKREKYAQIKVQLQEGTYVEIKQTKRMKRLVVDLTLTTFAVAGGVIFYLFASETSAILQFFVLIALVSVLIKTVERVVTFLTTRLYWHREEEKLLILSRFQPREYPLKDLKQLESESAPDLLRLHPLFTFLSANVDYTSSFQPVLKLSFPGEHVYLSIDEKEKWQKEFCAFLSEKMHNKTVKEIRPLWHPFVLKRFFWKGYFAMTVKGISAYTGFIILLIFLKASPLIITFSVIAWWLLNLYISDRVLIAATDAKEVTEGELYERANRIFARAKIGNTRLFITDSPIYNGFATDGERSF